MTENKEELKILLRKVKEESEKTGLKFNIQKDHGMWSHHFMANRWGNNGNSDRLYFLGLQNHCRWYHSHEIKRCLLLGGKAMTNLDSILKSGRYFANKGPSSQGYGFQESWMDVRVGL